MEEEERGGGGSGGGGKSRRRERSRKEKYVRISNPLKSDIQNSFLQPLRGRIQQTQ